MNWINSCWPIEPPLTVAQGVTPAFLMFGRELKTKLPELCPNKSVLDESTRNRDWNQKLAGKMYGDKQR